MESRIVPALFFCGEMIDVDGMTGGYNLQAAFSTGYLAGESAAQIQWLKTMITAAYLEKSLGSDLNIDI